LQLFKKIYYRSIREEAALYRSRGYQTKAVNEARLSSRRSSAADRQSVKRDYGMHRRDLRPDEHEYVNRENFHSINVQ